MWKFGVRYSKGLPAFFDTPMAAVPLTLEWNAGILTLCDQSHCLPLTELIAPDAAGPWAHTIRTTQGHRR